MPLWGKSPTQSRMSLWDRNPLKHRQDALRGQALCCQDPQIPLNICF